MGNINLKPFSNSEVISQILYGEKFKILSRKKRWVKIKSSYDNYIGYIKESKFFQKFKKTKKIFKLKSRVFQKKRNKFFKTNNFIHFGTGISVINENKTFFEFEKING